jgi:hypothetical protein
MPREATLVRQILAWLNAQPQTLARKRHGTAYGVGGEPDIFGCVAGQHFEIEVKQPGGALTPRQQARLHAWQQVGAVVGLATSLADAQAVHARAARAARHHQPERGV